MTRRLLVLCAVVALFVVACGGTSESLGGRLSPLSAEARQGGTLTVAEGTDADTLDPAAQTTTIVGQMVNMTAQPLVQMNKQGKIVPCLATSWSKSSDGTTYTFNLRRNVKFQDGEPFTAAAVVKSLDRLNAPDTYSAQPGDLTVIQSVTAVNDEKVQIQLKSAYYPFLSTIAETAGDILAPNSFTQHGNTLDKVVWPVGTGPYTYTGRVEGEQLTWSRFSGYWGSPKPAYAKQVYKVVPNAASREALVKSGQAQVIYQPPPNDLPTLEKSGSDVKVILGPDDRMIGVVVNTQDPKNPKLSDPRVRQALNYAINKTAIIQKIQFGAAKPLTAPLAPSTFGYCDSTQQNSYAYNVKKAKQLLKAAGAEGMTLTLASPEGHYTGDYQDAQAVQADLEAVGLHVTVPNPPTWPSYVSQINVPPSQASADLSILGWAPGNLDASEAFEIFQSSFIPPKGLNTSYWSSTQTDQLIGTAETATKQSTAQKDYCQAGKQVWNAAPWIWLYNPDNPIVTTTTVKNVYGLPDEEFVTAFAAPTT